MQINNLCDTGRIFIERHRLCIPAVDDIRLAVFSTAQSCFKTAPSEFDRFMINIGGTDIEKGREIELDKNRVSLIQSACSYIISFSFVLILSSHVYVL